MIRSRLVLFVLLACVVSTKTAMADTCADVLGAVYDRTTYQNYYSGFHSFESFFCDRTFSSASQARDAGAQVGIPIDGLPLTFGGHYRDSQWSEYIHELCSHIRNTERVDTATYVQLQQVNQAVIQAWSRCKESNAPGFYFFTEVDDAARTVSFVTRWEPAGNNDSTATLSQRTPVLAPGDVLDCEGQQFPRHVGKNPETIACVRRQGRDGALTAVVRTKNVGSPKAAVPAIPHVVLPPPCLKPAVLSHGAHVDASVNAAEAPAVVDGNIEPGNWNSHADAPQWVRIDLPRLSTVTHLQLNPEIVGPGQTVNQVSVIRQKPDGGDEELVVGSTNAMTISGGVFALIPPEQVRDVKAVRVASSLWRGWVSWREIEVYGCVQ